jgi:hypothetical protein
VINGFDGLRWVELKRNHLVNIPNVFEVDGSQGMLLESFEHERQLPKAFAHAAVDVDSSDLVLKLDSTQGAQSAIDCVELVSKDAKTDDEKDIR